MKQQEQQSSIPDTNHRLRNKETAIFLVSPDDFIHMSIREGPEEGANKGYNIDFKMERGTVPGWKTESS